MGLLRAAGASVSGVLQDQWREYFYCDSLAEDVLVTKGKKRVNRGSNNGTDNIITNGSVIAVNEGQCMMIVDQGAIAEFTAEAGEFTYDASSEPSVFYGGLGKGIVNSFKTFARRFTFGGETAKDQRIYFFNTKEIMGNKYGTTSAVPFRVVDTNVGLDLDISVRCHGEFSYKITDPILFYKNVCGNVTEDYTRDKLDGQMRTELLSGLQPAFARISELGIRYSALPGHTTELAEAINDAMAEKWANLRGVSIVSIGVSSIKASDEDEAMIKEIQRTGVYRNPNMAAAGIVSAQADAMRAAASNTATGPMMAFAGMNMAQNAGGMNAQNLFAMGQNAPQAQPVQGAAGTPAAGWKCAKCGSVNSGKFCENCGEKKPEEGWTCPACGKVNQGKFCTECGGKKPVGAPLYKCDKCGWVPEDPHNPPKFCPQCGDPFDGNDVTNG